jgi:CBS domain-containing protein
MRDARALILRDAESFHEAATVLEHVGQIISGKIGSGLGQFKSELIALTVRSGSVTHDEASRLFRVVREARNMAVHEGAWARHLSTRLVDLFLILEEAIMNVLSESKPPLLVSDVMVRSPVVAEAWQPVSFARRTMLTNSFSTLPIHYDGSWRFVTDVAVLRYLPDPSDAGHKDRLAAKIGDAVAEGRLALLDAPCTDQSTPVSEARRLVDHLPLLITERFGDRTQLVGILTAFDLL